MPQCGNNNKLALQQADFVPCDRLWQKAGLLKYEKPPACAMRPLPQPHPPPPTSPSSPDQRYM